MRTAGGGGPARAEAIVPQDVVLVVGIVLVVNQGTKLFAIVLDPCSAPMTTQSASQLKLSWE